MADYEDVRPVFTLKEAAELHLAVLLVLDLPPEVLKAHAGILRRAHGVLERSIEAAGGVYDGEEWRAKPKSQPAPRQRH